ncbi:hypothetical protein AB1Y20_019596 [Prymnesium parvum]|uniref:PH domain-containing protein n=1 Tax=Prymnesium parvum TaxID=97485 RepID=A0AB34JUV5_PRYPA
MAERSGDSTTPRPCSVDLWDEGVSMIEGNRANTQAIVEEREAPMRRKVAILEDVLKGLKAEEGPSSQSVADAESELEQALQELYMPLAMGWMVRLVQGGAILGVQDFWIERLSATLSVQMLPGRLSSGAHRAACVRIHVDGRSAEHEFGLVLRCERLRLHRIEPRLFLPQQLEVPSLTLALNAALDMSFAFGTHGKWVCAALKFDIFKLKSEFGGGAGIPDLILRWLLEKMLPGAIQKALLKLLPPELGRYLQGTLDPADVQMELKLWSTPMAVLLGKISAAASLGSTASAEPALRAAAEALGVQPRELAVLVRTVNALQGKDSERRDDCHEKKGKRRVLIGGGGGLCLLDLLRWRLECAPWEDAMALLRQAVEAEAEELKESHLKAAREARLLEAIAGHHRARVVGQRRRWRPRPRRADVAAVRTDESSSGSEESELDEASGERAAADDGEGAFGREAVSAALEALVVLGRKPVRWEMRLQQVALPVHLDQLVEALYRRRLRLVRMRFGPSERTSGEGGAAGEPRSRLPHEEALTRRLRSKLQHWLTRLKRNVSSAEWSVRSKLNWEGTRGEQEGHLRMKCDGVRFVGPVNVNVNVNSRAQMLTYSRLVSRRISVLDDGSMLVDLLIPALPTQLPRVGHGMPSLGRDASPIIPASLEALSLRRHQKRLAQCAAASSEPGPSDFDNEPGDGDEELICLVQAKVREWTCGVQLDLDALLLELQRGGLVSQGGSLLDAKGEAGSRKLGSLQMLDVNLASQTAPAIPDLSQFERPSSANVSGNASRRNSFSNDVTPFNVILPKIAPPSRRRRHQRTLSEPVSPRLLRRNGVMMSGWLFKYSRRHRSWRRRWFELREGGLLCWYKDDVEAVAARGAYTTGEFDSPVKKKHSVMVTGAQLSYRPSGYGGRFFVMQLDPRPKREDDVTRGEEARRRGGRHRGDEEGGGKFHSMVLSGDDREQQELWSRSLISQGACERPTSIAEQSIPAAIGSAQGAPPSEGGVRAHLIAAVPKPLVKLTSHTSCTTISSAASEKERWSSASGLPLHAAGTCSEGSGSEQRKPPSAEATDAPDVVALRTCFTPSPPPPRRHTCDQAPRTASPSARHHGARPRGRLSTLRALLSPPKMGRRTRHRSEGDAAEALGEAEGEEADEAPPADACVAPVQTSASPRDHMQLLSPGAPRNVSEASMATEPLTPRDYLLEVSSRPAGERPQPLLDVAEAPSPHAAAEHEGAVPTSGAEGMAPPREGCVQCEQVAASALTVESLSSHTPPIEKRSISGASRASRVSCESVESSLGHSFGMPPQNQQVRLSAMGTYFTRMVFEAQEVHVHAQLSNILLLVQHIWARLLNARDKEEVSEEASTNRGPFVFDDAFDLLMQQTSWWLQRSHLEQTLALHFDLKIDDDSGMTIALRNLKGEPVAAHFSDDANLLELLAEFLALRSAVRSAKRQKAQQSQQ